MACPYSSTCRVDAVVRSAYRDGVSRFSRLRSLALSVAALLALAATGTSLRAQDGGGLIGRATLPMIASDSAVGGTIGVTVYFFMDSSGSENGPFLVPVHRDVPQTAGVARAAVEQLLLGPTDGERASVPRISSTVPSGSKLRGLSIGGSVATVDLSSEFESGGGSASVRGRLAQLVFTLTRFSTVDSVVLRIEGVTAGVFTGEGLVIDGPLERRDFLDFAPAVLVESPPYGGPAGNPLRVTGVANVFEATFMLALTDNDGLILAEEAVTASCGTGCWGEFDVTIPYKVDRGQLGAVIVWVVSARDGSREHVREHPVWLNPR